MGGTATEGTATTYYYAVSAVTQVGVGQYSETTTSLEVSATLAPGQTATLNWTYGGVLPATSYNIYRGTSPDNLTLLDTTQNHVLRRPRQFGLVHQQPDPVPVLRRGDHVELVRRLFGDQQLARPVHRRQHQRTVVRLRLFRPGQPLDQYPV